MPAVTPELASVQAALAALDKEFAQFMAKGDADMKRVMTAVGIAK